MDNVFNKAAGAGSKRKFSNQPKVARFSPSYGVSQGFIQDPNWPPAEFPAEGLANARRYRRVPASFQVGLGRAPAFTVTGNLSAGGVAFTTATPLGSQQITVELSGHQAPAKVIASEPKGATFVHRAHFTDLDAAGAIWVALMKIN